MSVKHLIEYGEKLREVIHLHVYCGYVCIEMAYEQRGLYFNLRGNEIYCSANHKQKDNAY